MKKFSWVLVLLALSCGGGNSPTGANCVQAAGTYNGFFSNSCNFQGSGIVVVAQSGCRFNAAIPGQGNVEGTINGTSAAFTITFTSPCSGTASGTATLSSTAVNGTFSGHAIGSGCCDPVSGSFTLTR